MTDTEYVDYLEGKLRAMGAPECPRCGGFLRDSIGERRPKCPHCADEDAGEKVPDINASDLLDEWQHGIFKDHRDGFWTVDCNATHKWGTVGTGKSNWTLVLAIQLQQPPPVSMYPEAAERAGMTVEEYAEWMADLPAFDPEEQIVHHADYYRYKKLAANYKAGMVIAWDEMQKALSRRMPHQWRRESEMVIQQMRKKGLVTIGNCPTLAETAAYLILDRNQLLWRMEDRTSCNVYERNGFMDIKHNRWGHHIARIHHIPRAPEWAWSMYEPASFAKAEEVSVEDA